MIYLDHAATTYPHGDVVQAMDPYLIEHIHNPSAQYATGAAEGVRTARRRVATLIGTDPDSIVFTGGGSEADNLALKGLFTNTPDAHLVISSIEHPAVEETARWLEQRGANVTRITPNEDGRIDPLSVESAIRPDTRLVSIMHANNETGIVQPVEEIAQITDENDVLFHSDTVQSAGKIPLDVESIGLDLASLSAHKFYGPKGIGALYVRDGLRSEIEPVIHGGGQEGGLRSGTENVPGIVGMGVAAKRARESRDERAERLVELNEEFITLIRDKTGGELIGDRTNRLPGYSLFCFDTVTGPDMVEALSERGIAVSSGSACHSGITAPSRVLTEMGIGPKLAMGAVRFSMGRDTAREDVLRAADATEHALESL